MSNSQDQQQVLIASYKIDYGVKEFYQQLGDEEFKKIRKQKKPKRDKESQADNIIDLKDKFKKLIKDTKATQTELITTSKKHKQVVAEIEKLTNDNQQARNQIKVLDGLKNTLTQQVNDKKDAYQKVYDQEKQNKQELIESFQTEIKQIQERMEQVSVKKQQQEHENNFLKQQLTHIEENTKLRDSKFEEELLKIEKQKGEREDKIKSQMDQIIDSIGKPENVEEQKQKIVDEETLIDSHLNLYLSKNEEFSQMIEQVNKYFKLYKDEMDRIQAQHILNEKEASELHKKAEKSDILILDNVKEHIKCAKEVQQKKNQLEVLQNLLKQLQKQFE
ncbi:hypothetical protein pb186bvf_012772 [Paramecium bursaria]